MPSACTTPGCDNPVTARGLCRSHYDRWRRTRTEPRPPGRPPKEEPDPFALPGPVTVVCQDCRATYPFTGAACQKPQGHLGSHGGMTRDGTWRNWPRPHREKETP